MTTRLRGRQRPPEVLLAVRALQLGAAEQQCVLREQRTARMDGEGPGRGRTEASPPSQSSRGKSPVGRSGAVAAAAARQRKQQVPVAARAGLHTLLAEWGVTCRHSKLTSASLAAGWCCGERAAERAVPPPPGLPPRSA